MQKIGLLFFPLAVTFSMVLSSCGMGSNFQPTETSTLALTSTPTLIISTITPPYTATFASSRTVPPTYVPTSTPYPPPSDPPLKVWHHIAIMPSAIAGRASDGEGVAIYEFLTKSSQEQVYDWYIYYLAGTKWKVKVVLSNDQGGFIIYRKGFLDFFYVYEKDGLTYVDIFLSPASDFRDN
jgi:hypothetical protein